jgi:NADH-quinone oxidoreductase subunit M
MPVFGALFMICMLGSAGLPGLNGFVGEFMILVGSFTHHQTAGVDGIPYFIWHSLLVTAFAALGVVLGAVYLLHLFQKLMFGPITDPKNAGLKDLRRGEVAAFLPLIILVFWMGIYPRPFLVRMEPAVSLFLTEYKMKFKASDSYRGSLPMRVPGLEYRGNAVQQMKARNGQTRLKKLVAVPQRPGADETRGR